MSGTPARALAVQSYAMIALLLFSIVQLSLCTSTSTITTTTTYTSTTVFHTSTITLTGSNGASSTTTSTQTLVTQENVAASATPSTATATGAAAFSGTAFPSAILNSTNYFRAQHQASPLIWDTSLAAYAQTYANKCLWGHSVRTLPPHNPQSTR